MNAERTIFEAEEFLRECQKIPADKRLVFDFWSDRRKHRPLEKQALWRAVKSITKRRAAAKANGGREPGTRPASDQRLL